MAQDLSETGFELDGKPLKAFARRIAARAVLRRAVAMVGPIRPAMKRIYEPLREPFVGELDVERTLDHALGKPLPEPSDWIMTRRQEKNPPVVLMMDVSLSMAGRNLALAAVAAAVLALKIRRGDLAVIVFDSTARVLSHLGHGLDVETLVGEILTQPARGYTNIEDALRLGLQELGTVRHAGKTGLLVTDGIYTVGSSPLGPAGEFPRLSVLLTDDYKTDESLCRKMAHAGKGELFHVKDFDELPRKMLDIANQLLR